MDSNDLNMLFTTLNAARIMMKNRDRQPHEEAIYTAIQHCQDEVFPRLKADMACARKALETAAGRFNLMGGVGLVNGADPKVGYRECIKALTEMEIKGND